MRTGWLSLTLGAALGVGLIAWNTPQALAQHHSSGGAHHSSSPQHSAGVPHSSAQHSASVPHSSVQHSAGVPHSSVQHSAGVHHSSGVPHSNSVQHSGYHYNNYNHNNGIQHSGYHYNNYHHGGWNGVGVYLGGYSNYYHRPYYGYSSGISYPYTAAYSNPSVNYDTTNSTYDSFYYPPEPTYVTPPVQPAVMVTMSDNMFLPDRMEIKTGTTVRFTNTGASPHGLAQPEFNWQTRNFASGESYTWTFDQPGTYDLVDPLHPGMRLSVIVQP